MTGRHPHTFDTWSHTWNGQKMSRLGLSTSRIVVEKTLEECDAKKTRTIQPLQIPGKCMIRLVENGGIFNASSVIQTYIWSMVTNMSFCKTVTMVFWFSLYAICAITIHDVKDVGSFSQNGDQLANMTKILFVLSNPKCLPSSRLGLEIPDSRVVNSRISIHPDSRNRLLRDYKGVLTCH